MADRNNQPGGFDAWRRAQERAQERPREDERGQAADMQGGLPEEARIGLSWNEWGTIWKTARSQQTSLFWNHNSADNDAHCCINASIRNNETGELQRMSQIYGDADTHLKFGVAGGKLSVPFMTPILTKLRIGFPPFPHKVDTQANKTDVHDMLHGLDTSSSTWCSRSSTIFVPNGVFRRSFDLQSASRRRRVESARCVSSVGGRESALGGDRCNLPSPGHLAIA